MSCAITSCNAAARWHDTLCVEHVKLLPPSLQNNVSRISSTLLKTRKPVIFERYAVRYRRALAAAARAAVSQGASA